MSGSEADLELLQEALHDACALALGHFHERRGHWHKGPGQVVTDADLEVDELLHDRLMAARPDHGWLSEERPDDGSRLRARRVWMVDPIDGTRAFVEGKPEFTISVALVEDGRPVLGVIVNPVTGERFEALKGSEAWLDGEPCRVSQQTELAHSHLLSSRGERHRLRELMPEVHLRTMGSLAYKLALTAAGRFDGFVSLRRTHDWDIAAALLLLERAGGTITDRAGRPLRLNGETLVHEGLIAAGTSALWQRIRARLAG